MSAYWLIPAAFLLVVGLASLVTAIERRRTRTFFSEEYR